MGRRQWEGEQAQAYGEGGQAGGRGQAQDASGTGCADKLEGGGGRRRTHITGEVKRGAAPGCELPDGVPQNKNLN